MTQSEFLKDVSDPDNHRVLLWLALELTKGNGKPVAEFGAGHGSTKYLREYCIDNYRPFLSFENDKEWAEQHGSIIVRDWVASELYGAYSVVLIDQNPGDYRHQSMVRLKDTTDIIVVHDSEPDESMGYLLETIWHNWKYRVFIKGAKIWSAAVSNHYDLTQHVGEFIGNYKIEI